MKVPSLKHLTVKLRLLIIILVTSCLSVFLVASAMVWLSVHTVKKEFLTDLEITASVISENVSGALAFDDHERATEVLSSLKQDSSVTRSCLFNERGEVVASHHATNIMPPCPATIAQVGLETVPKGSVSVKKKVFQGDLFLGTVHIRSDSARIIKFLNRQVLFVTLITVLVIAVVSFPLANRLQKSISQPIYELVDTTRRLGYKSQDIQNALSYQPDEIKLIQNVLQFVFPYIEKIDPDASDEGVEGRIAVMVNNYLAMRYILHEVTMSNLSTELSLGFLNQGEYGEVHPHYRTILDTNFKISQKLQKIVGDIYELLDVETSIRRKGQTETDLEDMIANAFASVSQEGFNDLELIIENSCDDRPLCYADAFKFMAENVFGLFSYVRLPSVRYSAVVKIDENRAGSKKVFTTQFIFRGEAGEEVFDLDVDGFEQKLFNAKYFHNINSPSQASSFTIDVLTHSIVIASILSGR